MQNKFLIAIILVLIPSCVPLTQNSPLIKDIKKNLEITSENLILVGKKADKISEKLGLDLPPVTAELRDALKQLQADNDKKYELLNGQMAEILKTLAKAGLGAMGVPPAVTNVGFTAVDALMGAGGIGAVAKIGMDMYATRRREKEHQAELEEAEEEKEKIRLRLEREKEELRVKSLIKAETMAYIKTETQEEFIQAKEKAVKNLKARGEI